MAIPFIQPAVNAVKQWADFGASEPQAEPVNLFTLQAKIPFDQKYPKVKTPLKLAGAVRDSVIVMVGLPNIGADEIELALSRIDADTNHVQLSALIQAVISAWRSEHPDNSNEAARRKLLEHSSALSDIDNRWETARLAASQAEREQQEFEREYHNFRSIPARHKQLTDKAASLKAQRKELTDINFDARIKQLLELEYNAKVGTTIHGSAPAFLLIKQTLPIRLEVIDSLTTRIEEELAKLSADNERLAAALDLPEHKL